MCFEAQQRAAARTNAATAAVAGHRAHRPARTAVTGPPSPFLPEPLRAHSRPAFHPTGAEARSPNAIAVGPLGGQFAEVLVAEFGRSIEIRGEGLDAERF